MTDISHVDLDFLIADTRGIHSSPLWLPHQLQESAFRRITLLPPDDPWEISQTLSNHGVQISSDISESTDLYIVDLQEFDQASLQHLLEGNIPLLGLGESPLLDRDHLVQRRTIRNIIKSMLALSGRFPTYLVAEDKTHAEHLKSILSRAETYFSLSSHSLSDFLEGPTREPSEGVIVFVGSPQTQERDQKNLTDLIEHKTFSHPVIYFNPYSYLTHPHYLAELFSKGLSDYTASPLRNEIRSGPNGKEGIPLLVEDLVNAIHSWNVARLQRVQETRRAAYNLMPRILFYGSRDTCQRYYSETLTHMGARVLVQNQDSPDELASLSHWDPHMIVIPLAQEETIPDLSAFDEKVSLILGVKGSRSLPSAVLSLIHVYSTPPGTLPVLQKVGNVWDSMRTPPKATQRFFFTPKTDSSAVTSLKDTSPGVLESLLSPRFVDPEAHLEPFYTGVQSHYPGKASGVIYHSITEALSAKKRGGKVILYLPSTEISREEIKRIRTVPVDGIIVYEFSDRTHSSLELRGLGVPLLQIDTPLQFIERPWGAIWKRRGTKIGTRLIEKNQKISMDERGIYAQARRVIVSPVTPETIAVNEQDPDVQSYKKIMASVDHVVSDILQIDVMANADTPQEAELSHQWGAPSIVYRTENGLKKSEDGIFLYGRYLFAECTREASKDRLATIHALPDASLKKRKRAVKNVLYARKNLAQARHAFEEHQEEILYDLLQVQQDRKTYMRLLDASPHEYFTEGNIPSLRENIYSSFYLGKQGEQKFRELLDPQKPFRGSHLQDRFPEVYRSQIRAAYRAFLRVHKEGFNPELRIMVPFFSENDYVDRVVTSMKEIVVEKEFENSRSLLESLIESHSVLLETPQSCMSDPGNLIRTNGTRYISAGLNDLAAGLQGSGSVRSQAVSGEESSRGLGNMVSHALGKLDSASQERGILYSFSFFGELRGMLSMLGQFFLPTRISGLPVVREVVANSPRQVPLVRYALAMNYVQAHSN
ncbi:hypothetical protein J4410_01650 [Candidatus Woesearchaeota archaeon]|nr:hypothetical protein [Candidatus Woesearchaeota archaeon]